MKRVLAGLRRCYSTRSVVGALSVAVLVSVLAVGVETSVPDALIESIISMPPGTLAAMHEFIGAADAPDIDPDARSAMLADPQAWFYDNHGITFEGAVLWTADLTVSPPEEGAEWLFESQYLGEEPLRMEGIVLSGPELCLFIQTPHGDGPQGEAAEAITGRFLDAITGRSEEDWNGLLEIVQDVNRGSPEDKAFFSSGTREFLIGSGLRLSGANTRLLVVNIPLGCEYAAVHFGPIPEGYVLELQGLALIGESVVLVHKMLF